MVYYFIVNPNAGSGRGLKVWNSLKRLLARKRIPYDVYFTASSGDARRKAQALSGQTLEETLCLVTVGGDGTMNEVLDGLALNSHVVLSMIPCGSGNDLGRGLGFSQNAKRQLTKLLSSSRIDVLDYGVLSCAENGCIRRFLISSGIGLDAAVCHDLLDSRLRDGCGRLGMKKLAYLLAGVREFVAARPVRGWLLLDGVRKVEFNYILFISIHNLPSEGGGFRFAPMAEPHDGKLSICVVSNRSKLKLIQPLLRSSRKPLRETAGVHFFSCTEAHIHTEVPLAVHVDGESCRYQTDIDLRCVQGQLKFLR